MWAKSAVSLSRPSAVARPVAWGRQVVPQPPLSLSVARGGGLPIGRAVYLEQRGREPLESSPELFETSLRDVNNGGEQLVAARPQVA